MPHSIILRTFFYLVSCGLVVLAPGIASGDTPERIGLIAPLSGPVSSHGQAVLGGLKLGLESGGCAQDFELLVEDDGFDPKRTVSAARKLLDESKVRALLGVGSGPTHALAPIADQSKIPLLALAGDSSVAKGHPYTIRLRPPAPYEGKMIAQLAKAEGAKSVALVCSSNEFTLAICDTLSRELGPSVSSRQDLLPEETDFRTTVTKLRSARPTHVIPILLPGKLGIFARQAREIHFDAPFLGGVFFESSSDVHAAGSALIGAKYIMPDVSDDFRAAYEKLPSAAPGSIAWGAIFYDVGRLLCGADFKNNQLLGSFKAVRGFQGSVGSIEYREENGDQFLWYPFIKKQISSDGFVRIGKVVPSAG